MALAPASPASREPVPPRPLEPTVSTPQQTVIPGVPERSASERSRDSVDLARSESLGVAAGIAERANRSLRFYKDEETGRIAAKVVDRETGEVLRMIPPEEVLKLAARIGEAVDILLGRHGDPWRPALPAAF